MDNVLKQDIEYIETTLKNTLKAFDNKTVLVTGATGLVGSQLVKSLLYYSDINNANVKVIGIARNPDKAKKVFGEISDKNLLMVYEDIQKINDIDGEIDYIVHGANTTVSKEYVSKPVETLNTILKGTDNILKIAAKKKIKKIVYLSSMEIYGRTENLNRRITENDLGYIDILSVRSSYSEGKRMAECMCASYASEYNVPVVVARLAQVFGADVSMEDNRVFCQLAKCVINKENFVMHTTGQSMGNYCYTRDAVTAILTLLDRGVVGEAYNVVNEQTSTKICDMANMVSKKIANSEINVEYDIPHSEMVYGYAPDVTMKLSAGKINELGWRSEVDLENMYVRMIESMKERTNNTK